MLFTDLEVGPDGKQGFPCARGAQPVLPRRHHWTSLSRSEENGIGGGSAPDPHRMETPASHEEWAMNHRRIRNIFLALAVFGVAAAGAASAYANLFGNVSP